MAQGIGSVYLVSMQRGPEPEEPCPLYHVHDDVDGTWGWGATCEGCPSSSLFTGNSPFNGVNFSIRYLRAQNQRHYTVREEVAEIYEGARERGADIMKV